MGRTIRPPSPSSRRVRMVGSRIRQLMSRAEHWRALLKIQIILSRPSHDERTFVVKPRIQIQSTRNRKPSGDSDIMFSLKLKPSCGLRRRFGGVITGLAKLRLSCPIPQSETDGAEIQPMRSPCGGRTPPELPSWEEEGANHQRRGSTSWSV